LHTWPEPQLVPLPRLACAHTPEPSQVSLVQRFPSSVQGVLRGRLVVAQPPLPSHVELPWHVVGAQAYAVPPQVPLVQTSLLVQRVLSLQAEPFVWLDQASVAFAGVHTWPALAGFTAAAA
jgi:hypothetical protein